MMLKHLPILQKELVRSNKKSKPCNTVKEAKVMLIFLMMIKKVISQERKRNKYLNRMKRTHSGQKVRAAIRTTKKLLRSQVLR